jgi:hypothetical protein
MSWLTPLLIADMTIVLLITLLGSAVLFAVSRRLTFIDILAFGFPIGLGTYTFSLFVTSWMAIPLNSASLLIVFLILILSITALIQVQRNKGKEYHLDLKIIKAGTPAWQYLAHFLYIALVLGNFILSIGLAYHTWDAIALWGLKGYGIGHEGTILAATNWGNKALVYPLNIPIGISVFQILDGDLIPGSKLIFPMLFSSFGFGLYRIFTHLKVSKPYAYLGVLLIMTTPIMFEHGHIGYTNLALSYYLVFGGLLSLLFLSTGRDEFLPLAGLMLAFSIWSRPEGIFMVAVTAIPLLIISIRNRVAARQFFSLFLLSILIFTAWTVFQLFHPSDATELSVIRTFLANLLDGKVYLGPFRLVLGFLFTQIKAMDVFGIFFPMSLIIGPAILVYKFRRAPIVLGLFGIAAFLAAAVIFMYYLTWYDQSGLNYWLNTGFNRMFMPAIVMFQFFGYFMVYVLYAENKAEYGFYDGQFLIHPETAKPSEQA